VSYTIVVLKLNDTGALEGIVTAKTVDLLTIGLLRVRVTTATLSVPVDAERC